MTTSNFVSNEILRRPAVSSETGKGRSSLYNDIANGLFPHPVAIGRRAVGWPRREVEAINAARIAGKSDEHIRDLVQELEASRSAVKGAK